MATSRLPQARRLRELLTHLTVLVGELIPAGGTVALTAAPEMPARACSRAQPFSVVGHSKYAEQPRPGDCRPGHPASRHRSGCGRLGWCLRERDEPQEQALLAECRRFFKQVLWCSKGIDSMRSDQGHVRQQGLCIVNMHQCSSDVESFRGCTLLSEAPPLPPYCAAVRLPAYVEASPRLPWRAGAPVCCPVQLSRCLHTDYTTT